MIPRDYITEWRAYAPWVQDSHVEQDLILSRALVEIYSHPLLGAGARLCASLSSKTSGFLHTRSRRTSLNVGTQRSPSAAYIGGNLCGEAQIARQPQCLRRSWACHAVSQESLLFSSSRWISFRRN